MLIDLRVLDRISDDRHYCVFGRPFRRCVDIPIAAPRAVSSRLQAIALVLQGVITGLEDKAAIRSTLQRHERTLRFARCKAIFRSVAPDRIGKRGRDRRLSGEKRIDAWRFVEDLVCDPAELGVSSRDTGKQEDKSNDSSVSIDFHNI